MYEKRNLTYVLTALEAIEKIFIYAEGVNDSDSFFALNDQMNFNASQTLLLVIGEESKKIDQGLKDSQNEIPWHLISNLRNRIAHDYRSIDPFITWDIITNHLGSLKNALIEMLDSIVFEQELLEEVLNTSFYRHLKYLLK